LLLPLSAVPSIPAAKFSLQAPLVPDAFVVDDQ
jgi:hypothetical protein